MKRSMSWPLTPILLHFVQGMRSTVMGWQLEMRRVRRFQPSKCWFMNYARYRTWAVGMCPDGTLVLAGVSNLGVRPHGIQRVVYRIHYYMSAFNCVPIEFFMFYAPWRLTQQMIHAVWLSTELKSILTLRNAQYRDGCLRRYYIPVTQLHSIFKDKEGI